MWLILQVEVYLPQSPGFSMVPASPSKTSMSSSPLFSLHGAFKEAKMLTWQPWGKVVICTQQCRGDQQPSRGIGGWILHLTTSKTHQWSNDHIPLKTQVTMLREGHTKGERSLPDVQSHKLSKIRKQGIKSYTIQWLDCSNLMNKYLIPLT